MTASNRRESDDADLLDGILVEPDVDIQEEKILSELNDSPGQTVLPTNFVENSFSDTASENEIIGSCMVSSMVSHHPLTASLEPNDSTVTSSMNGPLTSAITVVNASYCTLPHGSSRRKRHDGAANQPAINLLVPTPKLTSHWFVDSLRKRRHCTVVPNETTLVH